MKRINRRAMLKGSIFGGTVAIGLPMLDAMLPRTGLAQTTLRQADRLLVHSKRHSTGYLEPIG